MSRTRPILLEGMHGLGDNLYQRAVLRRYAADHGPVYLSTPWPQLYADLADVRCVRPATRLRTQRKNAARRDLAWHRAPVAARPRRWHYVNRPGSLLQALCADLGIAPEAIDFSGPPVLSEPRPPYVVIRPATVRSEWMAEARNPQPEYLAQAAASARRHGLHIISVADLAGGHEWAAGPLPEADERYHAGELGLEWLLALVAGAAGVIGGVGWLLPAAIAYRVPMLLIYGGAGGYHGPERILDPRMDQSRLEQAMPDAFCRCRDHTHACDKTITAMEAHIDRWIRLVAC